MASARLRLDSVARAAVCALAVAAALCGCGRGRQPAPASDSPRVERARSGQVEVVIAAEPGRVSLDRDIMLALKISAPTGIQVLVPPLDDRLEGFAPPRSFEKEPVIEAGIARREICALLTPLPAAEHRLAPLAIRHGPASAGEPVSWFATPPILFEEAPILEGRPGKAIESAAGPVWIRPSPGTVAAYAALALAVAAAAFLIWRLARRVRRAIRLRRLSPGQRALCELDELLAKNLVAKGRVKDFYVRITMIVRRYIERAHGIRAPEQTTEEFLAAAVNDSRFSREVVFKLGQFLRSADLVKYAAFLPDAQTVDAAVATARQYIVTDSAQSERSGPVSAVVRTGPGPEAGSGDGRRS